MKRLIPEESNMKMSSAWKKLVGAWAVLAMLLAMTMGAAEETGTVKIMKNEKYSFQIEVFCVIINLSVHA